MGIDNIRGARGGATLNQPKKSYGFQAAPSAVSCYNHLEMKNFLKISGFILIIIGTVGLLLNDFVWEHSSTRTIIFAVVNFVGLIGLVFARFGMRQG